MYSFPGYEYYEDFNYGNLPSVSSDSVIGIAFLVLALVLLFALAICAVIYVFSAIGTYKIAKNRNMNAPYLAFIPVANVYLLGLIADDIERTMGKKTSYAKKLLVLSIITFAISIFMMPISFISGFATGMGSTALATAMLIPEVLLAVASFVIAIVLAVYEYIVIYKIFKEYSPENATLFLVLSVLFSIHPFILFAIRNKKSGYEKWLEEQQKMRAAQSFTQTQPTIETEGSEQTENPTETDLEQPDEQPVEQTIE